MKVSHSLGHWGLRTLLASTVATFAMVAAQAQEVDTDEDVIVVTAQQRVQSSQDVPISLQVLDSEFIDALAADDMGDLDAFVPGLDVSNGSPTQPRYSIRGITTSDFGVGTDPAVGVYVDGIYAARSGASLLAFNDVERIEVLKGPQGTLFGRNSAAGAVSIVTRSPSDEVEGRVAVRVGSHNRIRTEAMFNMPITENLAVRANVLMNKADGWLTDADTGEDYRREDATADRDHRALERDALDRGPAAPQPRQHRPGCTPGDRHHAPARRTRHAVRAGRQRGLYQPVRRANPERCRAQPRVPRPVGDHAHHQPGYRRDDTHLADVLPRVRDDEPRGRGRHQPDPDLFRHQQCRGQRGLLPGTPPRRHDRSRRLAHRRELLRRDRRTDLAHLYLHRHGEHGAEQYRRGHALHRSGIRTAGALRHPATLLGHGWQESMYNEGEFTAGPSTAT